MAMKSGEVNGVKWSTTAYESRHDQATWVTVVPGRSYFIDNADIPALLAALTAATAAESDGPRWPRPELAKEWLGRVERVDAWSAKGGVLVVSDERTVHRYPDNQHVADTSIVAKARALRDAKRAGKEKDEAGPRWAVSEVSRSWARTFVGRCDYCQFGSTDLWSDDRGAAVFSQNGASWTWDISGLRRHDGVWAKQAVALLDAHLAKAKAERVVVGWRVKDSDSEYVENNPRASFGWDWIDDARRPTPLERADALDLLRRCREWSLDDRRRFPEAKQVNFRLVRVTRRAK